MPAVLETHALTKRFGDVAALRDCELALPVGRVTGLVGPNGAGKTTLLQLAIGLRRPTTGSIRVLGLSPSADTVRLLGRVGYVGQDRPLYLDLTVEETLRLAARLNERWDGAYARERLAHLRLPLDRPVRRLSTGQRAQVALTLALAKHPELLLLDEPVANLDPVARLELLEELMGAVAEAGPAVIFASNALADVERICEHIAILIDGGIRVSGAIEDIEREHVVVSAPRDAAAASVGETIDARDAERQTVRLCRVNGSPPESANGAVVRGATLEEIVIGYLRSATREVH